MTKTNLTMIGKSIANKITSGEFHHLKAKRHYEQDVEDAIAWAKNNPTFELNLKPVEIKNA